MKKYKLSHKNKLEDETMYIRGGDGYLYTLAEAMQGLNMTVSEAKKYILQLIEAGYLTSFVVKTNSDERCKIIEFGGKKLEEIRKQSEQEEN